MHNDLQQIKYNKGLGQNFIFDTNLLNAIVADSGVTLNDIVLEIGAGAGTLTRAISAKVKKVISYEIDKTLQPHLQKVTSDCNNVSVVFADILDADLQELESALGGSYKIIANLPYYITTPIIFKFLNSVHLQTLTIMVQYEVAKRIVAKHNTSDYGALSVAVQARAEVAIVRKVSRTVFTPPPNVDSAIVQIKLKHDANLNCVALDKFIKASFSMRRKTLVNCLLAHYSHLSRAQLESLLVQNGITANARGESLSVGQMIELSKIV